MYMYIVHRCYITLRLSFLGVASSRSMVIDERDETKKRSTRTREVRRERDLEVERVGRDAAKATRIKVRIPESEILYYTLYLVRISCEYDQEFLQRSTLVAAPFKASTVQQNWCVQWGKDDGQ